MTGPKQRLLTTALACALGFAASGSAFGQEERETKETVAMSQQVYEGLTAAQEFVEARVRAERGEHRLDGEVREGFGPLLHRASEPRERFVGAAELGPHRGEVDRGNVALPFGRLQPAQHLPRGGRVSGRGVGHPDPGEERGSLLEQVAPALEAAKRLLRVAAGHASQPEEQVRRQELAVQLTRPLEGAHG